ncbi:MAG: phospho-N-acetylmuramoyl-pentapeptide-transferase [Candidatus Nanopelagicales bacterium]|nr:phospho-N-acetylmuramoyl-pentapeptide-transferase [Candidatus Nanopelagicales bacterium]
MIFVLVSAGIALLTTLFFTPFLIKLLRRRGLEQAIRVSTVEEPYPEHSGKLGTPSMGGAAIIVAVLLGYAASHIVAQRAPTASGLLALYLMVGLGTVGLIDDYMKIFRHRSTGIRARTKLIGQAVIAVSFAWFAIQFPDSDGITPASRAISIVRDTPLVLPTAVFMLWIWFLVTATTNAVNLTDGLDGLATGASVMTFVAYTLLAVWQYGQSCSLEVFSRCYEVRDPLDLAILASALAGACFGFLWWNTSPAQIFMGDTGSLALGGAIAALAVLTQTEMLLPFLGGIFVLVALSVIGQVGSFKLTGKRMFRMAPLHHHFEMKGWGEVTIVVRFWIIQGLLIGVGLGLFYGEWVRA